MAQGPLARKLAFSVSSLGGYAGLVITNAYLMYFYIKPLKIMLTDY